MLKAVNRSHAGLADLIQQELSSDVRRAVRLAAQEICDRHHGAVGAVVFYGSCLRDDIEDGRLMDFYVFVDDLAELKQGCFLHMMNAALPPNVYYLDTMQDEQRLRAKYAVMSFDQLARLTSHRSFLPTLWGRLAQPCRLVFARDPSVAGAVVEAVARSVVRLCDETAPLFTDSFSSRHLWMRAFQESYATEFRSERPDRPRQLYEAFAARYEAVTAALSEQAGLRALQPQTSPARYCARQKTRAPHLSTKTRWTLRRFVGRTLQLVRLIKSAFTFADGLDYLLHKLESHSGVAIAVTAWQKQHPILAAPVLAWRLYRRGAFR